MHPFVSTVHARGVLSFAPDTEPLALTPLNVLIGPNASGKSNLVELFELLKALPTDLAQVIRDGGGITEWLWKGDGKVAGASIEVDLHVSGIEPLLRYGLSLGAVDQRFEVISEFVERPGADRPLYNLRNGKPDGTGIREAVFELDSRQSILAQRKDPATYPELTAVGHAFSRMLTFREWGIGRFVPLRQPQRADLPNDVLLPDARNLGLILNAIELSDAWSRLNESIHRFLPRFKRLSTKVEGGTVQIFLHEDGLRTPVPATRLSDGTIRFIALLAILLRPAGAPLICIEEPELGLHPDALTSIAELLVEASAQTQLIVTTQSDVLVSALSDHAGSVVVCENLGGASRLSRLDTEKLQFWLRKYQLGEVWRIGELGGNP